MLYLKIVATLVGLTLSVLQIYRDNINQVKTSAGHNITSVILYFLVLIFIINIGIIIVDHIEQSKISKSMEETKESAKKTNINTEILKSDLDSFTRVVFNEMKGLKAKSSVELEAKKRAAIQRMQEYFKALSKVRGLNVEMPDYSGDFSPPFFEWRAEWGSLDSITLNDERKYIVKKGFYGFNPSEFEKKIQEANGLKDSGDIDGAVKIIEGLNYVEEFSRSCMAAAEVYLKSENDDKVEYYAKRAIEIEPRNPEVYIYYGQLKFKANALPEAAVFYEKALERTKNDEEEISKMSLYNLGLIYAELELLDRAEENFKRFIEVHLEKDDHRKYAEFVLERIKEIRAGKWDTRG
ncbi:MAG: hypothetical protein ABIL58_11530 [Pseudomonadota bacterium]